jgi:hypothetical protein
MNVSSTVFEIKGKKFHFFDVSGLRHHRMTWLGYFDTVEVILFVASLSCYDQMMAEDEKTNRMEDSINLFHDTINHKLLHDKYTVLFLNKRDLFEKKVKKVKVSDYFPDYNGTLSLSR